MFNVSEIIDIVVHLKICRFTPAISDSQNEKSKKLHFHVIIVKYKIN